MVFCVYEALDLGIFSGDDRRASSYGHLGRHGPNLERPVDSANLIAAQNEVFGDKRSETGSSDCEAIGACRHVGELVVAVFIGR